MLLTFILFIQQIYRDEVNVHISCSLLLKETNLKQVNGSWEIRGLENTLKYNNTICNNCKQPFNHLKTPFIIHCNYNDCPNQNCKGNKKCSNRHCSFQMDLKCLQNSSLYDIIIKDNEPNNYLKLLCVNHSELKGKGLDIFKIPESINNKFFSNYQSQQLQHQQVQKGLQHQQIAIAKGGDFSVSAYDRNQYNSSQGSQLLQQQNQQFNGNIHQNINQITNSQNISQNVQLEQKQNYPLSTQLSHHQNYQNFNSAQQKQQFPQAQGQPQMYNQNAQQHSHFQTQDKVQIYHNEQYSQQQKQNNNYYSNQQMIQKYDEQNKVLQLSNQSSHIQYQGQNQGRIITAQYDQNIKEYGEIQQKQVNQFESPPINEGFHQQQLQKQQKGNLLDDQSESNITQFRKNTHPPQPWGQQGNSQPPQQQNTQQGYQEFYQRRDQNKQTSTQYYQDQKGNYSQKNESIYQNYNNEEDKIQRNYSQPYENKQFVKQSKQEEDNNQQGVYQPYLPPQLVTQSQNGGYNSQYKSAIFPGASENNNPYANQQQGYDELFNQNDKNHYTQQGGDSSLKQQTGGPIHDNTYSFTSPNPISYQNKTIPQEYTSNNPSNLVENIAPKKPIYTSNTAGRKIINPNVDTNPNGISVDITDQIQINKFQQNTLAKQKLKVQESQQEPTAFQKINSHIYPLESGNSKQQNEYLPPKSIQSQGNQQENTNLFHQNTQYRQQDQNPQYQNSAMLPHQVGNVQSLLPQQVPQNQYPQGQLEQNTQTQTIQYANAQIQQQQYQQSQQQQNLNSNQISNNVPQGIQYGIPYTIQDNSNHGINLNNQSVRQWSQQRQQSNQSQQLNQIQYPHTHNQTNNVANFGVPQDRRQSQQQMLQHQQIQQIPSVSLGNSYYSKKIQRNQEKMAIESSNNLDKNLKIEENSKSNKVETLTTTTTNQNTSLNASIISSAVPTQTTTKKRGGNSKRGKKDIDSAQLDSSKQEENPVKNAKQTKIKLENKNKKKQSKVEHMDEELEQSEAKNQLQNDEITKDESQTFQQPQLPQQEVINSVQLNQNPPRMGSENNLVNNKIESQDSMDFQSQTSLGNQVLKQNLSSIKEIKYPQHLQQQKNQEQKNNIQPIPQKQSYTQQPQQNNVNLPVVQQNLPQPPYLTKQPSSGVQNFQIAERQLSMNQHPELQANQIPRNNSGAITQQANLQIARLQKGQSFQQAGYPTAQPIKKKSGPLINENYKPFFADLINIVHFNKQQIEYYQIKQNTYHGIPKQYQQISSPSPSYITKNIHGSLLGLHIKPTQSNNLNPNQQGIHNYRQMPLKDQLSNEIYSIKQRQNTLQQQLNPMSSNTQLIQKQQKLQQQYFFLQNIVVETQQIHIAPQITKDLINNLGNYTTQNQTQNQDIQIHGNNLQISNQAIQSLSLQTLNSQNQLVESYRQILQQDPTSLTGGNLPQSIINNQVPIIFNQPNMNNIIHQNQNEINQISIANINKIENEQQLKKLNSNQILSSNSFNNFSNVNEQNNLNISFNPSGHNQQYPISSNQQINFQTSSQSINLPSYSSIPHSQQSIHIHQNSQNNFYQKPGAVNFRQPSIQNSVMNTTAINQQVSQNFIGGENPIYRNLQIQQPEKNSQNIDFHAGVKKDMKDENINYDDINDEVMTESEESFWDYQQPEDWQHLIPQQQTQVSANKNSCQQSRNKSKLGGINLNSSQLQTQQKQQNKKFNSQLSGKTHTHLEKDPFFGIDPMTLVVKDFPQGEDEESVFQWWDQIDEVFFPSKIREAFFQSLESIEVQNINKLIDNLDQIEAEEYGITKKIPPIKLLHMSNETSLTENSSLYYLMSKDYYKTDPIPFKQPNYFSVLYFDKINNRQRNEQNQDSQIINNKDNSNCGYLAIYKLKYYDNKRQLSIEDKNIFEQFISQIEIVPTNDQYKIEEYYEKQVQNFSQINQIEQPKEQKQNNQSLLQKQKQDLSELEPNICKQFIGNNQNISIQQIYQKPQDKNEFAYHKNQITIKLKKIITLDKLAVHSTLQQSNFLNKYLQEKQKSKQSKISENVITDEKINQDEYETEQIKEFLKTQNLNDTPIEQNILSLEFELKKLQLSHQISKQKQNVVERAKKEGNYLELRNLSVRINDYLKWLTIRKNLVLGFSDRIPYDSENYFNYESEEKTGINLSHDEIIKEKMEFEKMTKAEQENVSQQKLKTAASELQIKQQQQQQRIQRKKEKKEEQDAIKSSINRKISGQKLNYSEDDEDDEDKVSKDEDDAEQDVINDKLTKDSIQEDKKRRGTSRTQRVQNQEGNQTNQYNEMDGGDNMHQSDRSEQEEQCEDKKSETKKQSSSLQQSNKKKKKQKQKKSNKFLETDCCVCFHHVNNENNTVVYCSQCNGSFHKHCYGIDFIPEEKFICKKCDHKNLQQQQQKKKNSQSNTNRPIKDELSKFYQCKICTETILPVTSIYDDNYYYHPTCLFIFNYAIYRDSSLQLRDNVTHQSIAEDIKKQTHISCEVCFSKKGLKVKCCNFGSPRQQFNSSNDNKQKKYLNYLKIQDTKIESCVSLMADMKEELIEEQKEQSSFKKEQECKIEEIQQIDLQKCQNPLIKKEDDTAMETENEQNIRIQQEIKLECELFKSEDEQEQNQQFGCNYYVHPLCAFLNGMEIWLDKSDEDKIYEQIIQESNFQDLQHLGLKILFKCNEHSDKINRNFDEQTYYRRFQINYKNICQYDTLNEYFESLTKQRNSEDEIWNEIAQKEKEYKEILNRKEIETSFQSSELFYCQNPKIKEQIQTMLTEDKEEEAELLKEEENYQIQNHHQQSLLNIEDDYYEEITPNITQQNDEVLTFDENENRDDYYDDDDNNSSKRRSRRHQQRRLYQLQQLSSHKNKKDSDDEFGNIDQNDNEYSYDDKKEGGRQKQFKQSIRRGSQRVFSASYSSLNENQRDKNKSRRSNRLRTNNQQTKNQNENSLIIIDDEENQESSFNQGQSSFENSQNKFNIKENYKIQNPKHNSSPKSKKLQTLKLNGIESKKARDEQEEEFEGIQTKGCTQKQTNQISQINKSQVIKYEGDIEDQDEEYEVELDDDLIEGIDEYQDNADEECCEEDFIDSIFKDSKDKGQEKQKRLKKIGIQKKGQQKHKQKQQITLPQDNGKESKSNSRGNSPSNKSTEGDLSQIQNQEEQMKKKILGNSKNITKNGKIGKGTSIFAAQTKKRNLNKNIGSKSSLKSIEIAENDLDEQIDVEDELFEFSTQNKEQVMDKDSIEIDEELKVQNKQGSFLNEIENNPQKIKQYNNPKPSKPDKKDPLQDINLENQPQNTLEIRVSSEMYYEDQKIQEQAQVSNNYLSHYSDQYNTKYQIMSRSPQSKNQTETQVHQYQKLEQEFNSQKQIPSATEIQLQSSNSTKYNLRKHQSKNYKGNLIRDDIDLLPNILNCPNFIEKQRNALKNHSQNLNHNQNYQLEEESIQDNTIGGSINQIKSKNKHQKQYEKNQKKASDSQKDILLHHSEDSSSNHEQNDIGNHQIIIQANQQNETDQISQITMNKNFSQEEVISNDQNFNTKQKNQRKKTHQSRTETMQQKQQKNSHSHNKSHVLENIVTEEQTIVVNQGNTQIQVTSSIINHQIINQKESQDLLDFDQFEEQDQILNPNNINSNQ